MTCAHCDRAATNGNLCLGHWRKLGDAPTPKPAKEAKPKLEKPPKPAKEAKPKRPRYRTPLALICRWPDCGRDLADTPGAWCFRCRARRVALRTAGLLPPTDAELPQAWAAMPRIPRGTSPRKAYADREVRPCATVERVLAVLSLPPWPMVETRAASAMAE